VLFNTKSSLYGLDGRIGEDVRKAIYTTPAVVPAYRWLDSIPPPTPSISVDGRRLIVNSPEQPRWWLTRVHRTARWTWRGRRAEDWTTLLVRAVPGPIPVGRAVDRALVQAVDGAGNMSAVAEWRRP
jgi:hypothetical protein